jgi:hypothetical protein
MIASGYNNIMNNTPHLPGERVMARAVELMNQEEFESYLSHKHGEGCYALRIARVEAGRIKATLKLKVPAPVAVAAPVSASEPGNADLHALGARWRAGEKISALAREAGVVWNKLWSDLAKLGYRPQSA